MTSTIRCFCALELPESVREALGRCVEHLRACDARVRWVPTASMHVTLKFFGDVERDRIAELCGTALASVRAARAIELSVRGLGVFPDRSRPRVVWAGLGGDTGPLQDLVERIEAAVEALGFARERRPFHAHVTIGRVRGPRNLGVLLDELDRRGPQLALEHASCDAFTLFESELTPHGSIYTPIERFRFAPG